MDAATFKPERIETDPGIPAPVDAEGVALAIMASPDAPPELQLPEGEQHPGLSALEAAAKLADASGTDIANVCSAVSSLSVRFQVGDQVKPNRAAYVQDDSGMAVEDEDSIPLIGQAGKIVNAFYESGPYVVEFSTGQLYCYSANALQLVRRKPVIVKVPVPATASLHDVAFGYIVGVDDAYSIPEGEESARPWWAPQDAEQVDKVVASIDMEIQFLEDRMAIMAQHLMSLTARRTKVINSNADLIAIAAPVAEGKSYKTWTGPWSRGTYRNQVDREPIISVENKAAAKEAGFFYERQKIELVQDTKAIRAAEPAKLKAAGIELIPQLPVSYKPFGGGPEAA